MAEGITRNNDETRIRMKSKEQLRYITKFLEKFYAWPKDDNPDNVNFKLFLKAILFLSSLGFPAVFAFFHLYHFRSVPITQLTEDYLTVLYVICPVVWAFFYFINLKGAARLFLLLPQVYHWEAFLKKDRIDYKKCTRVLKIAFLVMLVFVSLILELDNDNCEKRKIENNSIYSCGVIFPYYLPPYFENFPIRHYLLLHQGITILFLALILSNIFFISMFYIDKTICLMDYMISLVAELNNNSIIEDDKKVEEYLRQIIVVHQVIIRFNKWLNRLTKYFQMSLYVLVRLLVAVHIFHAMLVGYDQYIYGLPICSIVISLLEVGGQILINKSMDLETAVFNLKWYKMNRLKDRRSYHLLYLMSQRPIIIEAGPYLPLSFPLLLQTYKEIYSFTAMLSRLINKQT